mmetsp:Transcript_61350/g.143508  ORF Transcript_61350/g.143508 Transcript_61350/m.143508 type:complete len:281 (+) Transcript_61350:1099-1941(+)
MRSLQHCELGVVPDPHCRAPLGKPGSCLVVVLGALLEVIQASAPLLPILAAHQIHKSGVDFDSRNNAVLLSQLDHGFSICRLLVKRLREEDRPSAILAKVLRAKQSLAPLLPVLFCVLDTNGLQAQATGAIGLVHGQESFPWHGQGFDCFQHLVLVLRAMSPSVKGSWLRLQLHSGPFLCSPLCAKSQASNASCRAPEAPASCILSGRTLQALRAGHVRCLCKLSRSGSLTAHRSQECLACHTHSRSEHSARHLAANSHGLGARGRQMQQDHGPEQSGYA